MTTALVTGAAGFIGSTLSEALLKRGDDVIGIDTFETGHRSNLDRLEDYDGFSFFEVDVRDGAALDNLLDEVDTVFHQAAVASVPRSIEDPTTATDVNCTGTATVLDAARTTSVDTVVVASSSAVYGSSEQLPKIESMEPQPESPYALSKYYTEQLALQYDDLYDLDTVALRYFNVFGPRQDPEGEYAAVIPKFIELLIDGDRPVIFGDGDQTRDFVSVDDVVRANLLAADGDASGIAVNVASGDRISINDLVATLNDILGESIEPIYDDPRPGDVRHSGADIDRAAEHLGYEPQVDLQAGLQRTVDWFKQ